jgi:hypothetical protein
LPLPYRERGILTHKQLIAALMPYMEWISGEDLLAKFQKVVSWQKNAGGFRGQIYRLAQEGYIEAKYGDPVPAKYDAGFFFSGPPSYRRIRRDKPPAGKKGANAKRLGIMGDAAEKKRALARARPKKKKSKFSITKLTLQDYLYIIDNIHGASQDQLAEMFNISQQSVSVMQAGTVPQHLKAQLAQWRREGIPADT